MKKTVAIIAAAIFLVCACSRKSAPKKAEEPVKAEAAAQETPKKQEVKTGLKLLLAGHWAGQSNHFYFKDNGTFKTTFAGKPWTYGKWMITEADDEAGIAALYLYDERATVEAEAVLRTVPGYSKTGEGVGEESFVLHFSEDRQEIVAYDETDKVIKDNLSFVGADKK
ncbi:MAG TPA: hypothetical protein P5511_02760 [Candidatus Goldiibacteriota bacterium]|nr:hypothetical protein [Candidatus Goldiibacteriota bacterium]